MHDATRTHAPISVNTSAVEAIPGAVLARADLTAQPPVSWEQALLPDERALAEQIPVARRQAFVAGRVVLRHALVQSLPSHAALPILRTHRGAPALPQGVTGSISHKPSVAVALVAPVQQGHVSAIGIDVEERKFRAPFRDIARRILTEDELRLLPATDSEERYDASLLFFAAKEAVYKAIDPFVQRHVRFFEVEILPGVSLHAVRGDAAVRLSLPELRNWHLRVAVRWWRETHHVFAIAKVF